MSSRMLFSLVATLALSLSGCSVSVEPTESPTPTQSAQPTIDPTLIPTASPTALVEVDSALYQTPTGEYLFKVGDGPAWCTIIPDFSEVICEISEAKAQYEPLDVPDTCQYSYGYQISLMATKPDGRDFASFLCASGYYSDPAAAATLNSGESIGAADFTCYVEDVTARCENLEGKYIALGPKAWALGN